MSALRELVSAVSTATGSAVTETARARGGDINRACRVTLADGRDLFVKFRPGAPAEMYRAEAHGLAWLDAARAAPIAEVVAVGEAEAAFLALRWIEPGGSTHEGQERLGRDLARLHRHQPPGFGLDRDNYIGSLEQENRPSATWAEFYGERRLLPLTRRAIDAGALDRRARSAMERLVGRLDDLMGSPEPPARLHGDLWSGNALSAADGTVHLVDPSVYGGHREIDLAMMRLFGGFSLRTFAAYAEEYPLTAGHDDRVQLHQLYPLLVHAVLFGGHYGGAVERSIARYVGE